MRLKFKFFLFIAFASSCSTSKKTILYPILNDHLSQVFNYLENKRTISDYSLDTKKTKLYYNEEFLDVDLSAIMDYGMYDNTDKLLSKEFFTYSLQQWTSAQPAVIQGLKSFIDTTDFNSIYCPYPDAENFHIRTSSQYFKPLKSKPKSMLLFHNIKVSKPYYTQDNKYFFIELRRFYSAAEILSQQILVFRKEKDRYVYFYSTDLMTY